MAKKERSFLNLEGLTEMQKEELHRHFSVGEVTGNLLRCFDGRKRNLFALSPKELRMVQGTDLATEIWVEVDGKIRPQSKLGQKSGWAKDVSKEMMRGDQLPIRPSPARRPVSVRR